MANSTDETVKPKRRIKSATSCVYEMQHSDLGLFFRVNLRRAGKYFHKDFFVNSHGSVEAARTLAVAWRDKVIVENPPLSRDKFCTIVKSNNTSGVPGVHRRLNRHTTRDGKVSIYESWVACLPAPDGTDKRKSFSVAQFGEDKARDLAIEARQAALALIAGTVFRPDWQPSPVSTPAEIEEVQRVINAPEERRLAEIAEKRQRKRDRDERAARKYREVAQAEVARLERPSNRTGIPYIGRYFTPAGHGSWRVSIVSKGARYSKTFSDSVYGGPDAALDAAKKWRDDIFRTHKLEADTDSLTTVKGDNTPSGRHLVARRLLHSWRTERS